MILLYTAIVLLAVSGSTPVAASAPPECQLTTANVPVNYNGPDIIECTCPPEELDYIGNLNFLKNTVGAAASNQRNLEISLGHCETLELEVNAAEITYKQFDIKIHNTSSLVINQIRVVSIDENPQFVIVQNVTNLYLTGRVYCPGCTDVQGPLHLQFQNVEHVVVEDMNSTVPMKMTARHLTSLSLYRTYISQLPWPGIFVYNTTRVSLSYSILPGLFPKSISMTLGSSLDVTYNIMDVESSLNVQQFNNVNEQCNRKDKFEDLSVECQSMLVEEDLNEPFGLVGPIRLPEAPEILQPDDNSTDTLADEDYFDFNDVESAFNLTYVTYAIDYALDYVMEWKNDTIAVTALTHNGVYGIVFLTLCIIFAVLFALIYCCCRCCCKKRRRKEDVEEEYLERQLSSHLVTANNKKGRKLAEGDEYSNSSKAHLAHGMEENGGLEPANMYPYAPYPTLRYVTVQQVQSNPGADGVICGSLTLAPSPAVPREEHLRDLSSNQLKAQVFNSV